LTNRSKSSAHFQQSTANQKDIKTFLDVYYNCYNTKQRDAEICPETSQVEGGDNKLFQLFLGFTYFIHVNTGPVCASTLVLAEWGCLLLPSLGRTQ
jgi:hypothetical protein